MNRTTETEIGTLEIDEYNKEVDKKNKCIDIYNLQIENENLNKINSVWKYLSVALILGIVFIGTIIVYQVNKC